ncbi:MAG: hypothetical protein FJ121_07900 [Deltaproteobacteria bacterium]|nr:hypothetical protein [Deltaproteobacteria bacterium]
MPGILAGRCGDDPRGRNPAKCRRRRGIGDHSLRGIRKRGKILFPLREKIIFGSDYPLLPVNRYLKEMEDADLPEDWREMILGGNLARLLRWE